MKEMLKTHGFMANYLIFSKKVEDCEYILELIIWYLKTMVAIPKNHSITIGGLCNLKRVWM